MRRILVLSVFAFLFAARVGSAAAPTAPAANPVAAPNAITSFDICAPLDVNALSLSLSNFGAFAFDLSGLFPSGLRFPKGSGDGVVFASGLWLGATVAGSPRVTVAEYSQEYVPGSALFGLPESPELAQLKVYTLKRTYPTAAERDAALDSYNNNAVSRGAPVVTVQPDGSLNVPGDEMRCAVYNDLTGSAHNNGAGATTPLQVEVQQTTWAYDRPGPFGNSVFIRFKIINRGPITLNDMHLSIWADPDLGDFSDDLVGCDSTLSLGYCYNATNSDARYGATPPAVGYDLLQGPSSAALGARLPLTAFTAYTNGTDPSSASESFQSMHGRDYFGNPIRDPQSHPTHFMFAGDPVAGTSWVDQQVADKRMLLSSGPITMGPNAVREVVLAIIVSQGSDGWTVCAS